MGRDTLTFGKYKGELIADVLKKDPDYIRWVSKNVTWFVLPEGLKIPPKVHSYNDYWDDGPYWDDPWDAFQGPTYW